MFSADFQLFSADFRLHHCSLDVVIALHPQSRKSVQSKYSSYIYKAEVKEGVFLY